MVREPQAEVDGGREIEPARRLLVERAVQLVEAARQRRDLEIGGSEIVTQRLERAPRVRRRPGRGRDVTLELIDDEAETIAERPHRLGELTRDLDRDLSGDLVLAAAHSVPVSRNQVCPIPPGVRPCA